MSVPEQWEKRLTENQRDTSGIQRKEKASNLYTAWGPEYDKTLKAWKYDAPNVCARLAMKYLNVHVKTLYGDGKVEYVRQDSIAKVHLNFGVAFMDSSQLKLKGSFEILDCACGTGLVGEELSKLGFQNLIGCDLSTGMLKEAKKKNVYKSLEIADLTTEFLKQYAYDFDCLTCCGSLTYITKIQGGLDICFSQWNRLVKPGGIVIFTQKTKIINHKEFVNVCEKAEKEYGWKSLYKSGPELYLPGHSNYTSDGDMVYYFVYQTHNFQSKL